jgi:hypothetical protein
MIAIRTVFTLIRIAAFARQGSLLVVQFNASLLSSPCIRCMIAFAESAASNFISAVALLAQEGPKRTHRISGWNLLGNRTDFAHSDL